jgi:hypothetical protein
MAKDFVQTGSLHGKPKTEVIAMLGTNHTGWADDDLKWFLGKRKSSAKSMFPYEEYLVVEFDENYIAVASKLVNLE